MKSTLATLFTGAALALSLTGCALGPQQIEVKPTAEVQPANRGNNQPVQVIAVDSRDSKAFGSRGGVYKDTSLVQPANDLRPAIAETATPIPATMSPQMLSENRRSAATKRAQAARAGEEKARGPGSPALPRAPG